MRITQDEQEERRRKMIYTAYNLFCEHGIDNVSVIQLAKATGISRNTFFRYFEHKAQLVLCTQIILWEEISQHILVESQRQMQTAKNGYEKVCIILNGFKSLYYEHSEYILFSADYKLFLIRNHITLSQREKDSIEPTVRNTLLAALEEGQADGTINKDRTPTEQLYVMWGILRGYLSETVVYDKIY
ncbi:MAG: TetR family transcriptional regulator, partial [Oscillospiraceae bacterium]